MVFLADALEQRAQLCSSVSPEISTIHPFGRLPSPWATLGQSRTQKTDSDMQGDGEE